MQERLIFVISPPRAGSTLLQRMLGSHPEIFTHPEPHLITPLVYLGYYDRPDLAPFDHINSSEAIRQFVRALPSGEEDYLDALRAYADTMYGRMLSKSDRARFLDKTPAYALVLPFLEKLYPQAKYIVLTRHPLAVFSSYANSFFEGRWGAAHDYNRVVERYVPAIARFLKDTRAPRLHLQYEDLVADPEPAMRRCFEFLELAHDPEAVNYGERFTGPTAGAGDPTGVGQHQRPNTESVHKWAAEVAADPDKLTLARTMLEALTDDDLTTWGTPRATAWTPLEQGGAPSPPKRTVNAYTLQRRVLLALRKDIHRRPLGRVVRRVRYYCDVLLRDSLG